jgi:hypothetical protein
MDKFLNVALPKGRLGEKVYDMFEKAGYPCPSIKENNRKLIFENQELGIRFFWVKPSDVAIYVERGAADIGVAGKDILLEYEPDVYELFDLDIVAADIHTNRNNYTRFLILERCDRAQFEPTAIRGVGNKASLYLKIPDTSGSLYDTLGALEGLDINMTKLQSYPIADQPFHYMFHVDMEFGPLLALRIAVERMKAKGVEVHIYGVYNKNTDFEL